MSPRRANRSTSISQRVGRRKYCVRNRAHWRALPQSESVSRRHDSTSNIPASFSLVRWAARSTRDTLPPVSPCPPAPDSVPHKPGWSTDDRDPAPIGFAAALAEIVHRRSKIAQFQVPEKSKWPKAARSQVAASQKGHLESCSKSLNLVRVRDPEFKCES